jgi:hypothetical protein
MSIFNCEIEPDCFLFNSQLDNELSRPTANITGYNYSVDTPGL